MALKHCPFCGGEAKHESGVNVVPMYDEFGAYVDVSDCVYLEQTGCPACDIWFYNAEDDPEEATIERWNRRVGNGN